MRVIDFAYPLLDPRREGIFPDTPHDLSEEEEEFNSQTLPPPPQPDQFIPISIFKEMHQTHLQQILLPTLAHILHATPSLDDGLQIAFFPARVNTTVPKGGEWEMSILQDEHLLIAYRDHATESKNASPTSLPPSEATLPTLLAPAQLLPLTLDPDSEMFATHLREFVEYQKVYGDAYLTAFKVSTQIHKEYDIGEWDTCKMNLRLTEIGLVPKSAVQSIYK